MPRRSSRLSTTTSTPPSAAKPGTDDDSNNMLNENDNDDYALSPARKYMFDGIEYDTYSEMVQAKRQRNQQVLEASGLLTMVAEQKQLRTEQHKRGLQKRRPSTDNTAATTTNTTRRKSRRLAGIESDGMYVDRESAGRFTLAKDDTNKQGSTTTTRKVVVVGNEHAEKAEPEFYRGRVNDGADLSIAQAVELTGPKWVHETAVGDAEHLVRQVLQPLTSIAGGTTTTYSNSKEQKTQDEASPKSVVRIGVAAAKHDADDKNDDDDSSYYLPSNLKTQVDALTADNPDECVAKVVPDRIYGIAVHPAMDRVIVAAGDKVGHVGIWNVDSPSSGAVNDGKKKTTTNDGVHLFRFHSGAASCLEWTHNALFSASYDGTVRLFDVAAEKFTQVFATYDDTAEFAGRLGAGMDTGYKYWTQYATIDERFSTEQCFFLSTSVGTAMHVDLRVAKQGRVTFHEQWSEKKINTLSLHPNGHSMISAGLDCTVKLWDLRKVNTKQQLKKSTRTITASLSSLQKPIAAYHGGKSINSAYFSPSGKHVLTTTMNNKLDLLDNFHLQAAAATTKTATSNHTTYIKPTTSLYHDNHTGRWLSTFMARFHPSVDIFCVGSMQQPRRVEIFAATDTSSGSTKQKQHLLRGITGDALTAVVSRCCFHPRRDRLIVVGGNSSGRVTVVR